MTREEKVANVAEFMFNCEQEELLISVAATQVADDKYEFKVIGVDDECNLVDLFEFEAESPDTGRSYFQSIVEDAAKLAIEIATQTQELQA